MRLRIGTLPGQVGYRKTHEDAGARHGGGGRHGAPVGSDIGDELRRVGFAHHS